MQGRVRVESVYVPMKRKFNPFNFKAIETKYDGYHFRSRLEARWATFFNALDIPYEYEKEGYDLEGTWYLPDFWLPQQECFIEIKGQEPTEEEFKKAKDLALYTDQLTYVISGNIGLPDHKNTHVIHSACPPIIRLGDANGICYNGDTYIPTSLNARIAIQRLDELGMQFDTYPYRNRIGGVNELTVEHSFRAPCSLEFLDAQAEIDIQILHRLRELIPFIKKCEKELIEIFSLSDSNHRVYALGQSNLSTNNRKEWHDCTHCNNVLICNPKPSYVTSSWTCPNCDQGLLINNSPRLIAAYEAARQARF